MAAVESYEERWLTMRGAAQRTTLSYAFIKRAVAAGELRCARKGRRVCLWAGDVDTWMRGEPPEAPVLVIKPAPAGEVSTPPAPRRVGALQRRRRAA